MDQQVERDWWRVGWIALGVALAALVGYVVLAFVGTFVTGVFLYYATRPFHRRIRRVVRQRTLATLLTLLALAVPIIALVGYTLAITLQELNEFAQQRDLSGLQDRIAPYLDYSSVVQDPATLLNQLGAVDQLFGPLSSALGYLGTALTVLLQVFVVLAVAFYLLRDGHRIRATLDVLIDRHDPLEAYVTAVDDSLTKIFFGNLLNAIFTAVIGAVAYNLLNLVAPPDLAIPYPALLGVLAGVASLIPVVGMKLVWIPLAAILAVRAGMLGTGWGFVALFTGVSVVIVDAIPDLLLRPYVSGRNLHVGSVMVAYILGPLLFGWYGIFLGPLLLVVVVHFYRLVLPGLLAGDAVRPRAAGTGSAGDAAAATADPVVPTDTAADREDRADDTAVDETDPAGEDSPPDGQSSD
ncbi:AI-2E family transporter [Halobacteriales archaeon Cl-PHB]